MLLSSQLIFIDLKLLGILKLLAEFVLKSEINPAKMFSISAVVLHKSNVCYYNLCLAFFIASLEIVFLGFDFMSPALFGFIPR